MFDEKQSRKFASFCQSSWHLVYVVGIAIIAAAYSYYFSPVDPLLPYYVIYFLMGIVILTMVGRNVFRERARKLSQARLLNYVEKCEDLDEQYEKKYEVDRDIILEDLSEEDQEIVYDVLTWRMKNR